MLSERQGSYALPGALERTAVQAVRSIERTAVAGARRIVVLSRFMAGEVEHLQASARERTRIVPGGFDATRFTERTTPPLSGDGRVELFTARRLTPRTGVVELVEAMPTVRASIPDVRLSIAGDGALRGQIERRIAELGLAGSVHVLGKIPEEELTERYRTSDLVVMPTKALEGFGLTTAEALASGTPVVATPVGANPEVVGPLSPDLMAADAGPPAIAAAIVRTLADPDALRAIASRARAHVVPDMTWERVADAYLEEYAAMADGRDARG